MGMLEGKRTLITGAGSGMARATARIFVREGAEVFGVDISGREEETAEELGDAFVPFRADVADESQVEAMFTAALERFGRLDAVLNVAGIGSQQSLVDVTPDAFERTMGVNLHGVFFGTKHAVRSMLPTGGGAILNWSSTAGLNAPAHMGVSVYATTKAGVIAVTKSAAVEYGPQGIRANALCPGLIVTELSGGPEAIARHPGLVENAPLRRAGQPEEVGELACFLVSDRATFITGAIIPIDGGQSAVLH